MIDGQARNTIGGHLRRMYEERPKGGIPRDIWALLLTIEARYLGRERRATPVAGPTRDRA